MNEHQSCIEAEQELMGEIVDLNKKYIARGDRIQKLESAIREYYERYSKLERLERLSIASYYSAVMDLIEVLDNKEEG